MNDSSPWTTAIEFQTLVGDLEKGIDANISDLRITERLLDYQLRNEERNKRQRNNWHASDLGGCPTGPYFDRLTEGEEAETPDMRSIRVMASGSNTHDWIESKLENLGILIAKENDLYFKDEQNQISGRGDYLLKVGKYYLLYDVKTVNSRAFWWNAKRGYKAYEHHQQQIHWYREQLQKTHPRKYANSLLMFMLYVSRDDWSLQEIYVPHDPKIDAMNSEFINILNEAWSKKIPPKPVDAVIWSDEKQKYEVNWKAKYNNYYHLAVGNENWQKEAESKVRKLNKDLKYGKGGEGL